MKKGGYATMSKDPTNIDFIEFLKDQNEPWYH